MEILGYTLLIIVSIFYTGYLLEQKLDKILKILKDEKQNRL